MELLTKSSIMNEIVDYIQELKASNNGCMSDRIFAANVILDKVRRMEPYAILHVDMADISKSNIHKVNNSEE